MKKSTMLLILCLVVASTKSIAKSYSVESDSTLVECQKLAISLDRKLSFMERSMGDSLSSFKKQKEYLKKDALRAKRKAKWQGLKTGFGFGIFATLLGLVVLK